jgi:LemA protein
MNQLTMIFIGVALLGLSVVALNIYNGLVGLRNQVERAWANIDVILKQRFDEIPQLVQVIEQYTGYEAGILKELADARSNYGSARNVSDKIKSSQDLSVAIQGVMAIGEAYPELKANQNFSDLQKRISSLESTIADRRESYNETVANFNTRIDQFPDVLAANILGYQRQVLFKASEVERSQPSLKMNLPKFGKGA